MSTSTASLSTRTPSLPSAEPSAPPGAAPPSGADLAMEAATWAAGGGILTMALFPFALPLILLTAAALIPLLLLGLVVGVVAAVAAAPVLLARRLLRARRGRLTPDPGAHTREQSSTRSERVSRGRRAGADLA